MSFLSILFIWQNWGLSLKDSAIFPEKIDSKKSLFDIGLHLYKRTAPAADAVKYMNLLMLLIF